jgi:excinuclease ABC subunit B
MYGETNNANDAVIDTVIQIGQEQDKLTRAEMPFSKILYAMKSTDDVKTVIDNLPKLKAAFPDHHIYTVTSKTGNMIDGVEVGRKRFMDQLRDGTHDNVLIFHYDILSEGIDIAGITGVALLRAMTITKLIQTIGRAARNVNGEVHMYGDNLTDSMKKAIDETNRRRDKQVAYNLARGVDPKPLQKRIVDITDQLEREEIDTAELIAEFGQGKGRKKQSVPLRSSRGIAAMAEDEIMAVVIDLDAQMRHAAKELQFELAARLRDEIGELKHELRQMKRAGHIK